VLTWPRSVRVFLCTEPTDMRRSFDTLAEMTRRILEAEPLSGHLFVFTSRRGDRIKILYWDRGGYALWYKRLEKGCFHLPIGTGPRLELDVAELSLLLEGIDLSGAHRRKRFEPMAHSL
jgi:transposase